MTTVAIFGGGVAGLSAAHELASRGFAVTVYERDPTVGGKAASQVVPVAGMPPKPGNAPLPGEHGFRFFPGFYRNVIATMEEIPGIGGGSVRDDLVPSEHAALTWNGKLYPFNRRYTGPSWDVLGRIRDMIGAVGFTVTDIARMAFFRIKYLTSGMKRRADYDKITWWDFIDGASPFYSDAIRRFEKSIPRTMSAMVAATSSAKVIGDITMQFLLGYGRANNEEDRLLIGPSSVRWLEPWKTHLENDLKVVFKTDTLLRFVMASATHVGGAMLKAGGTVQADHYVAAIPVDDMRDVVKASGLNTDPELGKLVDPSAPPTTAWMVGAQFYLKTDEPMVDGHVFYPNSPWALTSVSQGQFWKKSGKPIKDSFGDGTIDGILSVIVSDWDTPDASGTPANQYNDRTLLLDEVRRQLDQELGGGNAFLSNANVPVAHLDDNVTLGPPAVNRTTLLVHPKNGLAYRPQAATGIDNLVVASDYVLTSTQLATMEGANEAARLAVNAILDRVSSAHVRCPVWTLQEEPYFEALKRIDDARHDAGLKHFMDECPAKLAVNAPGLVDFLQEALKVPAALPGFP